MKKLSGRIAKEWSSLHISFPVPSPHDKSGYVNRAALDRRLRNGATWSCQTQYGLLTRRTYWKQEATLSQRWLRDAPNIRVPWKLYVSAKSADDCARISTLQSYHYSAVKLDRAVTGYRWGGSRNIPFMRHKFLVLTVKQDSIAIAKKTARCAQYMDALKSFQSPHYAPGYFSRNL